MTRKKVDPHCRNRINEKPEQTISNEAPSASFFVGLILILTLMGYFGFMFFYSKSVKPILKTEYMQQKPRTYDYEFDVMRWP